MREQTTSKNDQQLAAEIENARKALNALLREAWMNEGAIVFQRATEPMGTGEPVEVFRFTAEREFILAPGVTPEAAAQEFPQHVQKHMLADNAVRNAAPQLLDSLLAVEWAGTYLADNLDEFDACPNCLAPKGGFHYAHCELRDSLDAALGVKSQRVVHPAHAKEAARG